jgi:hypothetical protein
MAPKFVFDGSADARRQFRFSSAKARNNYLMAKASSSTAFCHFASFCANLAKCLRNQIGETQIGET